MNMVKMHRGSSAVKFQTLMQGAPVAQGQTNPIIVLKTSYVIFA